MSKHPVPEWKKELLAKKAQGPPKVLQDPPPKKWECDCPEDETCMCCEWGDWPICYHCRRMARSGMYFYKSHDPKTRLYYCMKCFETVPQ